MSNLQKRIGDLERRTGIEDNIFPLFVYTVVVNGPGEAPPRVESEEEEHARLLEEWRAAHPGKNPLVLIARRDESGRATLQG